MLPLKIYIQHPDLLGIALIKHFGGWMSNRLYLQLRFRLETGRKLNLNHPSTFEEKLQWLKLYDHCQEYTMMVDKVKVKEYVADTIGSEHVIPLLGVWNKPEDIDWNTLPDSFVLKTNHSGGNEGIVICSDKKSFDRQEAIHRLNKSLRSDDVYENFREWPYKNVPRRVFAEEYIAPPSGVKDLPDYKWFCFGGEPMYCQVIQDRTTHETIDFFDTNWIHQEFVGLEPKAGNNSVAPSRPANLDTHLHIARQLSKGIPFVRIDLYETDKGVLFGEITFYPKSGFGRFTPCEWSYKLGELIHLPTFDNKTDEKK